MSERIQRRTVLRGLGVAATAGVLAGCSSSSGGGGGDGGGGGGDGSFDSVSAPSDVDDYLSGQNNYSGDMADATGADNPTVDVGAADGLSFGPAAIKVSTGTTITWEWTGQGGTHNVVEQDGAFDSGSAVGDEGTTFEHTFEEAGTFPYFCEPHKTVGMKGAVVVE